MKSDDRSLADILDDILTEYEIFVNNSAELIKEYKALRRKERRKK